MKCSAGLVLAIASLLMPAMATGAPDNGEGPNQPYFDESGRECVEAVSSPGLTEIVCCDDYNSSLVNTSAGWICDCDDGYQGISTPDGTVCDPIDGGGGGGGSGGDGGGLPGGGPGDPDEGGDEDESDEGSACVEGQELDDNGICVCSSTCFERQTQCENQALLARAKCYGDAKVSAQRKCGALQQFPEGKTFGNEPLGLCYPLDFDLRNYPLWGVSEHCEKLCKFAWLKGNQSGQSVNITVPFGPVGLDTEVTSSSGGGWPGYEPHCDANYTAGMLQCQEDFGECGTRVGNGGCP
jgi:hypothetical protein